MKKSVKYLLITAGACILGGMVLSGAGRLLGGHSGFYIDKSGLHPSSDLKLKYQTGFTAQLPKTPVGDLSDVDISCRYHDIYLLDSGDGNCYLEYMLPDSREEPDYSVLDRKLVFSNEEDEMKYTDMPIQFFAFDTEWTDWKQARGYVKLYLPEGKNFDCVRVYSSDGKVESIPFQAKEASFTAKYGSITLDRVKADSLAIECSDGSVKIMDGKAGNYAVQNSYGSITVDGLEAENLTIQCADGRISLNDLAAEDITVVNKYGRTNGSNIKAKKMTCEQSDGSLDLKVLDVQAGDFKNSYGSLHLELTGAETDYNYDLKNKFGSLTVNGRKYSQDAEYEIDNGAAGLIRVRADDGTVKVLTK